MTGEAVSLPDEFSEVLEAHGIGRRRFLQYCAGLAGVLALPSRMTGRIARGLAQAATSSGAPRVIWLAFQDCAGCTEAFLRSQDPDVASLVFGMIALDYQETLMAAAGAQAEAAREAAVATPGYLLIVEGSIPQGMAGAMTVGGKAASDLLTSAAGNAAAIVAVGTCASFGGIFGFIINHLYSSVLVDVEDRSGEISSMITGWKDLPRRRVQTAPELQPAPPRRPKGHRARGLAGWFRRSRS